MDTRRQPLTVSAPETPKISIVVMAHPRRRLEAERLREAHPELGIRIVMDPDPDGPPATLRTAREAWAAVPDDATHHLVLQDDVIPCPGFADALEAAVRAVPDEALALFAPWTSATSQAARLAALQGASWTPLQDGWVPTQALLLPAAWARELSEVARNLPDTEPDNRVVHAYLDERGRSALVSVPSLVEHAAVESLLFNDLLHGVREATVFAGPDAPRPVFTDEVLDPPAVSHVWLGGGEFFSSFTPTNPTARTMVTPTHEVLAQFGMPQDAMATAFAEARDAHPEVDDSLVSESLQFSMWLTMFATGVIASGLLDTDGADELESAWRRPWAERALATFPAATLRKIVERDRLAQVSDLLVPFCREAMTQGLAAPRSWPRLAALWRPNDHEIIPHWARGAA